MAATRDDFTTPENGWPWPWADSSGTDFAYAFDGGQVYVSNYGSAWVEAKAYEAGDIAEEELEVLPTFGEPAFPDMTDIQNVDFGKRSGVIIVGR
jgi:hypothetical protein